MSGEESLITPSAHHLCSAYDHRAEYKRTAKNSPRTWPLAEREHDPERIQHGLDQGNQHRLECGDMLNRFRVQRVGQSELHSTQQQEQPENTGLI